MATQKPQKIARSYEKQLQRATSMLQSTKAFSKKWYQSFVDLVRRAPLRTFFVLLVTLFILIAAGNYIRQPEVIKTTTVPPIEVSVFHIGTAPRTTMQAQIDKSGIVTINSLATGVVKTIYGTEGQAVPSGSWLIGLTSNYQGGNTFAVSRQIAEKQYQLSEESYPMQMELIQKQRDAATTGEVQFEKLRDITNQSISDTQSSIDLNSDIINTLDTNLTNLTASPSGNDALILATKELKSQFASANNQLKNAIRQSQYQADSANPPTSLAGLQRDITLKQLDIQQKALDLTKEMSKLQLSLARISEGLMYPSAPFSGIIERILVRQGQMVNSGTPLVVFSGSKTAHATATVYAPDSIAKNVSRLEPTIISIGSKRVSVFPSYISSEATNGNLYSIMYTLPDDMYQATTDKEFVTADMPIGYPDTGSTIPFIPIDAIYQTRESATVFVLKNGIATNVPITIGDVFGRYIRVLTGIQTGDIIILDRSVIDGESVVTKQ